MHIITPRLYSRNSYRDPNHIQHFAETTLEILLEKHFNEIEMKGGHTWVHIIRTRFDFRLGRLDTLVTSKLPFMVENLYAICSTA
jgi:hypothetical protein